MIAEIDAAQADGDTLGGVVEVIAYGLPVGLGLVRAVRPAAGRPARGRADGHPGDEGRRDRRRVPHRAAARQRGARRDAARATPVKRLAEPRGRHRGRHDQRRAGAGAGRDEADLHRAAGAAHGRHRDGRGGQAIHQRSDVCAVPAAGVVAEAMVALVLADAALEKFGGDSLAETRRNVGA